VFIFHFIFKMPFLRPHVVTFSPDGITAISLLTFIFSTMILFGSLVPRPSLFAVFICGGMANSVRFFVAHLLK
jgi:hypothetical protein